MLVFPVLETHWRVFGLSMHAGIPLPNPAKSPLVHFELPHMMRWVDRGSYTTDVTFDGLYVAQKGHDVGKLIVHISVPPTNPLLPLTILGSSCKVSFAAPSVEANGKAVGTYFPLILPPIECTDNYAMIPLSVIVPFPCTVMVGMTPMEMLLGWAGVVADIVIKEITDRLFDKAFKGLSNKLGKFAQKAAPGVAARLMGERGRAAAERALERVAAAAAENPAVVNVMTTVAKKAVKKAVSAGVSLVRSELSPPAVDFTAGVPHAD